MVERLGLWNSTEFSPSKRHYFPYFTSLPVYHVETSQGHEHLQLAAHVTEVTGEGKWWTLPHDPSEPRGLCGEGAPEGEAGTPRNSPDDFLFQPSSTTNLCTFPQNTFGSWYSPLLPLFQNLFLN